MAHHASKMVRWLACAAMALSAPALVGCSNDDAAGDGNGGAIPAPAGTGFTSGEFDDIPVFRGATPVQPPTENDGTWTASYQLETGTPEEALRFYEEGLAPLGWTQVDPVVGNDADIWRADWVRDGRRLQVVASPAPQLDGTGQLNLLLLPDTGDIPVGGTSTP